MNTSATSRVPAIFAAFLYILLLAACNKNEDISLVINEDLAVPGMARSHYNEENWKKLEEEGIYKRRLEIYIRNKRKETDFPLFDTRLENIFYFSKYLVNGREALVPIFDLDMMGKGSRYYARQMPPRIKMYLVDGELCFEVPFTLAISRNEQHLVNEPVARNYTPLEVYRAATRLTPGDTAYVTDHDAYLDTEKSMFISKTIIFRNMQGRLFMTSPATKFNLATLERDFGPGDYQIDILSDFMSENPMMTSRYKKVDPGPLQIMKTGPGGTYMKEESNQP